MRSRKNNIIIGSLLSVLLIMAIGYAAFSTNLNIKGISNISSNWDIEITNIRSTNSYTVGDNVYSGTGYDIEKPTYTSSTATFSAGLERPGDFMVYEVEVSNLGSLDGQITVTSLSCGDNEAIYCYANYIVSEKEFDDSWNSNDVYSDRLDEGTNDCTNWEIELKSKDKMYIYIMVKFDSSVTSMPESTNTNISLTFNYQQYNDSDDTDTSDTEDTDDTTILNINDLKKEVVTTGDGLYTDSTESGRYVYKGASPSNYIVLGEATKPTVSKSSYYDVKYHGEYIGQHFETKEECEEWLSSSGAPSSAKCKKITTTTTNPASYDNNDLYRIIAIESDNTLKVIKSIDNNYISIRFDAGGRTSTTTTDYCYSSDNNGCSVWGSKTTTLDSNGNNVTQMPRSVGGDLKDLPSTEASSNTYLNGTWYNTLSSDIQSKIVTHTFNIGVIKNESGQTLAEDLKQEQTYKWAGKIGLPNMSDAVKSSTSAECTGVNASYNEKCSDKWISGTFSSSLNPLSSDSELSIWSLSMTYTDSGYMWRPNIAIAKPTFYLSSDITFTGSGTESDPYIIE